MSNPQEIEEQIERTRSQLSSDVDRLTDKVSPSRVAQRQVDRVKSSGASLRNRVMGSADDHSGLRGTGDSISSAAGNAKGTAMDAMDSAKGTAMDAMDSAKDAVGSAPQMVRSRTQGSPLAAGLVAFGIGMVLSSLIPATEAEQHLAAQAESKAKELAEPAKHLGQQMAEELKPTVQDAVEEVKSSAQNAAQETTEQAKSAADDVKAPMQQ